MASTRTFAFAGVARRDGELVFRASTREGYGAILVKEGDTDVQVVALPNPMTKDEARKHLLSVKGFGSPEIKALLNQTGPSKEKTPRLAKSKPVAVEMERQSTSNLDKIKAAAARVSARKAEDTVVEPTAETPPSEGVAEAA